MATTAIHVVPDDSFDDRIVRDDAGCEFGHFPTREAAELTAKAIVQEREAELIIHFPDGRTTRKSFSKAWLANCSGDDRRIGRYPVTPLRHRHAPAPTQAVEAVT